MAASFNMEHTTVPFTTFKTNLKKSKNNNLSPTKEMEVI